MKKILTLFTLFLSYSFASAQCGYVIEMQDSYGDGWNGASIDVSVNGSIIANVTVSNAAGSGDTVSVDVLSGDAVDFAFNSGQWDSEITFTILDPTGASLGSFGPSPATGSFLTHTSNSICNTHFAVNTQLITVGANGMYAGGGVLGDALAVPLSDEDGDGTWEGFATVPTSGGNYIFLNSPSNPSDWGAKEDLSGQACSDPANWNDRIIAPFTGNQMLQACFGNCVDDGTCGAVVATSCYYTIDMQDSYGDGWNGASVDVSLNGTFVANWGLSTGSAGLDSIATLNGDLVEFSFNSGSYDSEVTFQITDPTGSVLGSYGPSPATGSFLTSTSTAPCQPATVNVTFQVDMGLVTAAFTTPEVNGNWNNWSGGTNPMTDSDGDGIWEVTIPLLSGAYEYKYAADNWTIQEMNDPNASCTNGDPVYTNRVLSVGTVDMVIPSVCWGSCVECLYPPQAPAGLTCAAGNPGLIFTDEIDPTTGWSGDVGTGNGIWRINSGGTASGGTGPSAAHSGANYLFFEASTGGLDTATAITPMIDLTSGSSDAELTFWMHAYGSGVGTLRVGVSTSSTGPFTELYSWTGQYQTGNFDPWVQVGVNMTSYIGQVVYVSFTYERGTAGTSYQGDLSIDLIQVHSCLSCVASSGLTASNVTASSADVSWSAGGTETEWFLVVNGAGTTQTSTTANLTGLMPNTAYSAQVHAVCAPGDTSVASPAITFNTLCNAALAPVNETFDAGFSSCWSQETNDDFDWTLDAGGTPSNGTGPSDDFTGGGNYMYTEASAPRTQGDVATMYSEVIDISGLTNPELIFLNHMYGDAIGTLSVDLWDASTGTNLGTLFTHTGDRGNQWNEENILLSTNATNIQFSITAVLGLNAGGQTWPGDIAVDEFTVREAPTCYPPTIFTINQLSPNSANISWNGLGNETAWNTEFGPAGFPLGSGTVGGLFTDSISLNNLTSETDYDFYVQSYCGNGDFSSWNIFSFTTPAICPEPQINSLTASNITLTSADLSWVANGSETSWNIEYGVSGFGQGSGTIINVNSNPYTLTGLSSSTNYDYWVQADCGFDGQSYWVGPLSFNTPCANEIAPYFEDFDYGLSPCWTQESNDDFDWSVDANGTPSSTTGPSDDVTGGGNYIYIETSSPRVPGDSALIHTNSIDISGLTSPELRFFSHMYGASVNELSIWITDASGTFSQIFVKTGDQGDQWNQEIIDLSAYTGIVQFTILGIVGDDGTGVQYWGDIAIDNFEVREQVLPPFLGTWKLASINGATSVGPNQGDGSWWSNSYSDVSTRACLFDDSLTFNADFTYNHYMDGTTWVENWQDGSGDRCDIPVAPHVGGSFTYSWDDFNNILTVNGFGAHLGFPKVNNSGEINDPNNAPLNTSYVVTLDSSGNFMIADINFGTGWWQFIYQRTNVPVVSSTVTYQVDVTNIGTAISSDGINIAGNFADLGASVSGNPMNNWDPLHPQGSMTDLGNGKWEIAVDYPPYPLGISRRALWKFVNGNWGGDETNVTSTVCGGQGGFGNDRYFDFVEDASICFEWNTCNSCLPASPGSCLHTFNLFDSYGDGWNGGSVDLVVNGAVVIPGAACSASFDAVPFSAVTGDVISLSNWVPGSWPSEISWEILDGGGTMLATGFVNDVISVTANCPSCLPPNSISANNITGNSADLAWTAGGTETQWNIQYGATGFNLGSGTVINVSTNPYTLTNLNGATAYDYWIQSVCGSDSTSYQGPFTFITSCSTSVAPTNENFDVGFPICWSQEVNDQFDWSLNSGGTPSNTTGPTDDVTGGGNYIYIETSSPRVPGDSALIHTNTIDISGLTSPELRFFSHMYGASVNELSVWITDASGTLTQVFVKTGDQGNQWNEETVDLSAYTGLVQFTILGIVGDDGSGVQYWGDIAVDEFGVRERPTCPKPSSSFISSFNITINSADIYWQPGANETLWNLEFGQSGFVQGSGNLISVSTNPFTLTGLNSSTSYDVYIQANCGNGDLSEWSGPHSFYTLCGNAVAPYYESFNSGVLPNCWSQSTTTGDGWRFTGTPGYDAGNNGRSSGSYAWIDFSSTDQGTVMELPSVNVSTLINPSIEFDYFCFNSTNPQPSNILYIETFDGNNWIIADSLQVNTNPNWKRYSFILTGFENSGILNLRLRGESGGASDDYYNDILVDDLAIKEAYLGTWKLATIPGAFKVGPNFNDGSWWSSSIMNLFDRSCHFDDSITFSPNGDYIHHMNGGTFIENWQDGQGDRCDVPVYPHDGSVPATWTYDATTSQITLNGLGAHMGLPKVNNSGEISDPANAVSSITYDISFSPNRDTMYSDINFGPGWWRYVYVRTSLCAPTIYTDNISAACGSYTWPLNGNTYQQSNNSDIAVISNGQGACNDSIVLLDLNLDYNTTGTDVITACDSYTWINGVTYIFSNNTSTYTITKPSGCDSVVTLDLTINYSTTGTDVITACDSYTWIDGITYTSSNNTATHTIQNSGSFNPGITFEINSPSSLSGPIGFSSTNDVAGWGSPDLNLPANSINAELMMVEDGTPGINPQGNPISQEGCSNLINDLSGKIAVIWRNSCQFGEKILNAEKAGAIGAVIINRESGLVNMSPGDSGAICTIPAIFIENADGIQIVNEMQNGPVTAFIGTAQNGNAVGCDSVVTLDLTILNTTTGTDVITACDSYTWIDGITYTSSNNAATHTLTNAVGCDSIVTLDLTINYTTAGTDVINACDSYTWIDGITYTSSNFNAKDTLINAAGCDSVVSLNLSVQYSTSSYSTVASCNSYDWNGQTYTNSGIYIHLSTNPAGCIQTDSLDLTITTSSTTVNDTVCDSYTWNGNTFTTSGTYYNQNGSCVDTLNLVVNYSSSSYLSTVACDEYIWNGNTITGTGLYLNTSTNSDGCPQYDSLDLTVNYSTFGTDIITACDSYTWIDGITYTSTNNTAKDTLVNSVGCDSIVTLDLRMYYTNYGTDVITSCDSYTWIDGITYTSSNNTATDTLTNVDGCDSIVTLDLTINYSIATNDSLVVCDVANWNGNLYYNSGIYVDTLQTVHGCDSVVTMDLTVNYSIATNDSLVVCDSAIWNGNTYTATGTYVDILQTVHGCDSVVTMDLTVNYSIATNDSLVVCDSAIWNGNTYDSTGVYVDTLQTVHGCDSVVTMDLTVNYSIATNDSLVVCNSTIWNGNTYDSTGIYVDTLQTVHGCDSIVTMDLVVNYSSSSMDTLIACYEYIWNGNSYDTTGIYVDTLQTVHGCDSIAILDLTIIDISVGIDTAQQNLLANIIGGMGPYNYAWNTGETAAAITPTANGQYWLVVIDVNGCSSDTAFFDVTFLPNVGIVDNGQPMVINVYPNPTLGNVTIDLVKQQSEVQVTLYDMYGKLVYLNKYQDYKLIEFSFDAPPGIYYLNVKSGEKSSRHKIIMQ